MGTYHLNITATGSLSGREVTVEADSMADAIEQAEKDAGGWKVIRGTGPQRPEQDVEAWIAARSAK
jgi:hypothetical protein